MDGSAFVLESGGQAPLVTQPFFREEGKIGDGAVHEPPDQPLAELEAGLERALVKLRPPQVRGSPDHEAHSPTATGGGGPQIFQPTQAAAIVVMEHVQQVPELAATERAAPQLEEGQEVPESTHAAAAACQLEEGQPAPDVALALDAGPQREEGQQLPSSPQETAGPAEQVGQQEPETARVAEGAPEWQQGLEVSRQAASAAADPGHGLQGPDSTQPAAAPVASASAVTAETPAAAAAASPPSGAALGSPTGRQGGDVATAYQSEQTHSGGQNGGKPKLPRPEGVQECPRCSSKDTKFCYYNNYNIKQPRYFCRACQRYWTAGGSLREIPVGAGRRKSKAAKKDGFTGERGPQAATAATAVPPSAGEPALSAAAVAMAASMAAAPAVSMVLQPSAAPLGLSAPVRNPLPVAAPGLLGPAPVLPQDPALAALLAAGGGGGAGLPLPNGTSLGAGVPPQMTMPGALPPPYGMQPPGAVPSMMPQGNPYMPLRAGGLVQGLGAVPPHAAAPGLPPFIGAPPRITAVPSSFPPASYPPAAPAQTLSSLSSLPTGPPVTAGAAGPSAAAVLSETLNKLTALPSSALGGPHGYPPPLTALTSLGQGSLPTSSAMAAAAQALGAAQSLGGRVDGSGAAMGSSYGVDDSLPGGSRPAMVPMAQPLQQDEDCEEDGGMDRDGDRAAKRTKLEPAVLETAAAAAAAAAAQGRMDEPGGPGTAINAWQQQEPGVPQQREPAFPPGPSPNPLTGSAISALATLAAAAQGAAAMGPSLASSGAPGMVPQPLPPAPTASPFGGGPSAYGPSTHASSLATLGRFYEGLAGAAGPHAMPAALGHGLGGSMGSMLGPSDATLGVAGPLSSEFFAAARAAAQQQQQGLGLAQQLPPGPYGHPGGPMHALAGGGGGWPYGGGMGPFIPHQQQGWGGGYPPQGPGYGMPRYQFPSFGGLGAAPNPLTPQMPSAGLGLTGLGSMLGGAAAAALPPSLREAEMARALAQVPTCAPPSSVPLGWLGGAAGPSSWAGMPPSNGLVGLAQLNPNLNPAVYPTALNSHHHQQQQQQPFSMLPQHQQPPLQQQQQQQQYLPPALLGQGGGYGVDLAGLLPPGAGGFFPGAGQGAFGLGGGPPGAAMVPEAAPSQMDSARA